MDLRPDRSAGLIASPSRFERPIIILGAPRSGTTLLAELLSEHPDVARTREARLVWRYGNDRLSDELGPEQATPRVIEAIHRSFERLIDDRAGRLVEKTPANSVRPWFVDAVFPDALFVHITRDGWSCVPAIAAFWEARAKGLDRKQASKARRRIREARPSQLPHYAREFAGRLLGNRVTTRMYGPRVAGLQQVVAEHGVLSGSALQWQRCVEQSCEFGRAVGPARYIEVHLESLDAATLAEVVEFCGLAPSRDVITQHERRYDAATARRRRPLGDDERKRVAPVVTPLNTMLGYPASPDGAL